MAQCPPFDPNKTSNVGHTDTILKVINKYPAAWVAFNESKNENELAERLQDMKIPQGLKAVLWEAKHDESLVKPGEIPVAQDRMSPFFRQSALKREATDDCRNFQTDFAESLPLGNADQVAIEKDY